MFDVANVQYTHIERNREIRSIDDVDIETIKQFLRVLKILAKN